jgi:hypothetical protein
VEAQTKRVETLLDSAVLADKTLNMSTRQNSGLAERAVKFNKLEKSYGFRKGNQAV